MAGLFHWRLHFIVFSFLIIRSGIIEPLFFYAITKSHFIFSILAFSGGVIIIQPCIIDHIKPNL